MSTYDDDSSAKPRRAPKSCAECRRRKIRCSWLSEDSQRCRRCEERNSVCVAQSPTALAASHSASSKTRIGQLEAEVKRLRRAVSRIESRLDIEAPQVHSIRPSISSHTHNHDMRDVEEDENDNDDTSSKASEVLIDDHGSHMNTLFQNEWISTDTTRNNQLQHDRQKKTTTQLLDKARDALQPLVPDEEEVATLSNHLTGLLSMLQELSPTTSLASSPEAMIACYPLMKAPDIDTFKLACWLMALAIASQQVRKEAYTPQNIPWVQRERLTFAEAVKLTVERHIMSHDSILGTVSGLETAMMFMRLNLSAGVLQKSWLGLRRIIAIAELIGLPRASRIVQIRAAEGTSVNDHIMVAKARLWESICSVERLAGTLMNFPITTRSHLLAPQQSLVLNGKVNAAAYWLMLSNIAIQVQELDDLQAALGAETELYARVIRLDNELQVLASSTPKDWWSPNTSTVVDSGRLLRFQHYCIAMRVHLPFALRSDPSGQYTFSRVRGIEACRAVARSWCEMYRLIPYGMFFTRPMDAQTFTAAVVLLLASHGARSNPRFTVDRAGDSNAETIELLSEFMQLMEEKSEGLVASDSARKTLVALRSLSDLLDGNNRSLNHSEGLTLKVPMLGQIHIQRKGDSRVNKANSTSMTTNADSLGELQSFRTGLPPLNSATSGTRFDEVVPRLATPINNGTNNTDQDMFSWIINNDDETFFQDNLMFENYELLNQWQPS